jgi:hypothetical protein
MFKPYIEVTQDGIVIIGNSPAGVMNVTLEGITSAQIGYITSSGSFHPYADGDQTGDGATVVGCGIGTQLAVSIVGAPCKIMTKVVR